MAGNLLPEGIIMLELVRRHMEGVSKAGKKYKFDRFFAVCETPIGVIEVELRPTDESAGKTLALLVPEAEGGEY